MMLSLAHSYHQVLLAQGLCVGIGSAIPYVRSISIVASRFERLHPLAVFFTTLGTAAGTYISPHSHRVHKTGWILQGPLSTI